MVNLSHPTPDVLGADWQRRSILLQPAPGYGAHPEAVLVNRPPEHRRAVLYVHGFTDYFFQADHAERWREAGFDFYALDLRLNGRSLTDGDRPGAVRDLRHHDEEIDAAMATVRAEGHDQVVLLGHSMGGLVAVGWADRHPGGADAVVLNSPWLDHNGPWLERVPLTLVVRALARVLPGAIVGGLQEPYGRFLHASTGGEWDYDLGWKPLAGFPVRAGLFASVRREQARLARGLDVVAPVLLCCSTRTGSMKHPTAEELRGADCVLDVAHMLEQAPSIGADVTVATFDGGIHDLALSPSPAREQYEETMIEWATSRLDGRPPTKDQRMSVV
ncbi:MAG: alpha/beta hydrolase [Propionibacterium sp.]|nr:alpha/beta hydrolase [Propionibacterium sp.]